MAGPQPGIVAAYARYCHSPSIETETCLTFKRPPQHPCHPSPGQRCAAPHSAAAALPPSPEQPRYPAWSDRAPLWSCARRSPGSAYHPKAQPGVSGLGRTRWWVGGWQHTAYSACGCDGGGTVLLTDVGILHDTVTNSPSPTCRRPTLSRQLRFASRPSRSHRGRQPKFHLPSQRREPRQQEQSKTWSQIFATRPRAGRKHDLCQASGDGMGGSERFGIRKPTRVDC